MRFLHLSDLHIGKQLNGISLLADQRFALENLLTDATRNNVDALVLAGDLYDKSAPSAEATALLDWFLTEAARAGLTVLAVPGNHDSAERVAYASSLLSKLGIHIPSLYDGRIEKVELRDEHGIIAFWLIPFLKPAHVRRHFPDAPIEQDYTSALRCALEAEELDPSVRNVAIAHQFVTFAGTEPARSDSEISIGGVDNVDSSVFDAFDYVALGHIHRPQRIGRDTVRYSGSLLKYSTSEAAGFKSAVMVDLGAKNSSEVSSCVDFSLLPVKPLHDLRAIRGPLDELVSDQVVQAGDPGDYLHVTLTDEEPALDALFRLRAVYPNVIALDYDNTRTRHAANLAPTGNIDADLDPFKLFARFYEEQNGTALTPDQKNIVAQALQSACDEEGNQR